MVKMNVLLVEIYQMIIDLIDKLKKNSQVQARKMTDMSQPVKMSPNK